ncbi:MAG: PEP-CTERM sorting domain-containing protein [Nitrospirae bacterium]|nr:PEP-CTERM sorting domain-containing protein [Nitrospirota bacterium]
MRNMKFIKVFVMSIMMTIMPLTYANADLITNGSFEEPALSWGTWNGSYTSIPGWIATFGTIEIQNHAAGTPFDGNQLVELDSWGNSGMRQDISTAAGTTYDLNFAYSPRPGVAITSNIIDVYFEGVLLDSLTGTGGSDTNWTVHHYFVTATDALSTIEFRAGGVSDTLGGYLDAVHFTGVSVPEPSTLLLLSSGLLGLALYGRRKFRK